MTLIYSSIISRLGHDERPVNAVVDVMTAEMLVIIIIIIMIIINAFVSIVHHCNRTEQQCAVVHCTTYLALVALFLTCTIIKCELISECCQQESHIQPP